MKKRNVFFKAVYVGIGIVCFSGTGFTQNPIEIRWPEPIEFGKTIAMEMDTSVSVASLHLSDTETHAWTFNTVLSDWNINVQTKTVSDTPYNFPGAEWAYCLWQYIPELKVETVFGTLTIADTLIEVYNYRRLSHGWIEELGMEMDYEMMKGAPFYYPNPSRLFPNPLNTLSPAWTERRRFEPTILVYGGQYKSVVTDSSIVSVDAWGNLTIPCGTFPCLRLKRHEFRRIDIDISPYTSYTQKLETYTYVWITYNFDMVLAVTVRSDKGDNFTTADLVVRASDLRSANAGCDPGECQDNPILPSGWQLIQNYPNPFNPTTLIQFVLPQPAMVELKVFSILGQEVFEMESSVKTQGVHEIMWDGRDAHNNPLPAGVYFYQLKATPLKGGTVFIQTKKMIMTK